MNRGRNTLILLVLGLGLGAYIYFVEMKREPASDAATPDKTKLFTVDAAKIEEVQIKSSAGEQTTLRKTNNAWQIVAPQPAAADETEASGIATNLSTLEIQRVVDEKPADLASYGLANPRIEVAFKTPGDKEPRRLLIGEKTVTGGDLYAKLASEPRVFLISSYLDGTFDRTPFQLRDKSVLEFDRDKADAIEIASGAQPGASAGSARTIKIVKQGDQWALREPLSARADLGTVESFLSRLSSGQMKGMAGSESKPLKQLGLEPPATRVTVNAGSASAGLLLGNTNADGDFYARDVSRPIVFTVEKALADDLRKSSDDFRVKDLFGFRAFTGNRLEITKGGNTVVFERKKGTEKDAIEKWTQVQPATTVDETKIEDVASKTAGLRAASFVDALPAGASEVARAQTTFDDRKKQETVVFHKAGEDYFATRADDPGAAKIDKTAIEDLFKALDALAVAAPAKT